MRHRLTLSQAVFAVASTGILCLAILWRGPVLVVVAASIIGGGLAVIFIGQRIRLPDHDHLPSPQSAPVSAQAREFAIQQRGQALQLSDVQLELLGALLLRPAENRVRVREVIDLTREPVDKRTTVTFRIPPSPTLDATSMVLVPIVRPEKKRLINNFKVVDNWGDPLDPLTYEESLAYLSRLAEYYILKVCGLPAGALAENQGRLLAHFLGVLTMIPTDSELSTTSARSSVRARVEGELDQLLLQIQVADAAALDQLRRLTRLVSCNYAIVAWTPSTISTFTYAFDVPRRRYTSISRDVAHRNQWNRMTDYLRSALRQVSATSLSRVRVSVNKGNSSDSYHLHIIAPLGGHIGSIDLLDEKQRSIKRPKQPSYDFAPGYFRVSGKSTGAAHLYARGLARCSSSSEEQSSPMAVEVSTYENPPGTLGRAFVVSAVILFALYLGGTRVESGTSLNIDSFALTGSIIAAILLVAGWVIRTPQSQPRVSAALTHVSLVSSIVLLILGALLVARGYGSQKVASNAAPFGLQFFDVVTGWWVAICLAALVNTAWTGLAVVIRVLRKAALAQRDGTVVDSSAVQEVEEQKEMAT